MRVGEERRGKERKGGERKGEERIGEERKGEEKRGKESIGEEKDERRGQGRPGEASYQMFLYKFNNFKKNRTHPCPSGFVYIKYNLYDFVKNYTFTKIEGSLKLVCYIYLVPQKRSGER